MACKMAGVRARFVVADAADAKYDAGRLRIMANLVEHCFRSRGATVRVGIANDMRMSLNSRRSS